MSYRQNDTLINSGQPPTDFVFRVVSKCKDIKNALKKTTMKPTTAERKPDHTEISGFFCDEWPLGRQHQCIPAVLTLRDGMLAFKRDEAEDANIECLNDGTGDPNHICIKLPRYLDEDGNTATEYEVKRDVLFSMLKILWTDCEPPVEIIQ